MAGLLAPQQLSANMHTAEPKPSLPEAHLSC